MCPLVSFHERPDHVTVWARAQRAAQSAAQVSISQTRRVFDITALPSTLCPLLETEIILI